MGSKKKDVEKLLNSSCCKSLESQALGWGKKYIDICDGTYIVSIDGDILVCTDDKENAYTVYREIDSIRKAARYLDLNR